MRWIVIPRWDGPDGFQHYHNRDPNWIKNYRRLLHDDRYLSLSFHQRGVLHGLWLEYAAAHRQIPDSTLTVTRRLGNRVSRATLDALNHAGFIEFSASKPLAPRYQDARPEKEKEKSKNPHTPTEWGPKSINPRTAGTNPRALAASQKTEAHDELLTAATQLAGGWNGYDSSTFDEQLDLLEQEHMSRLTSLERDLLWTLAFQPTKT